MSCCGAQAVKRNREEYGIPLQIVTYEDLYGWTMDSIVRAVGKKNNCYVGAKHSIEHVACKTVFSFRN